MPELIRSNSGRLPPAYDDAWGSNRHAPQRNTGGGQTTDGPAVFLGLSSSVGALALPVSKERPAN